MNFIDNALNLGGLLEFYNLNASGKCFIAGGACTRLFFDGKTLGSSDIDIYVNEEHREFLGDTLIASGNFALTKQNDLVTTYTNIFTGTEFQLIYNSTGDHCDDTQAMSIVLQRFDNSACRLVYKYGQLSDCGVGSMPLLRSKLMQIYSQQNPERMIKYLMRYPLKLDLTHRSTILFAELMREQLYTRFNTSERVIDNPHYE